MRIRIAIALLVALDFAAQAQYLSGPRGGCYTISSSGRKRYVDRSLCSGGSVEANSVSSPRAAAMPASEPTADGEAAKKLLAWFKAPAEGEIERAVKSSIAKRLGLSQFLPPADRGTQ
jgi:hypothetical protein